MDDGITDSFWVICSTTGNNFTPPVDYITPNTDSDCSDGSGGQLISASFNAEWNGLTIGNQYFFSIFPVNRNGSDYNFKTDGNPPVVDQIAAVAFTPETLAISTVFENGRSFVVDSDPLGGLSGCGISSGGSHAYVTQELIIHTAGVYEFENTAVRDAFTDDTFLALYTTFDPDQPTQNLIGCNDDAGVGWYPKFSTVLDPGNYTVVLTTYDWSSNIYGTVDWEVSGITQPSSFVRSEPNNQPNNISAIGGAESATVTWDDAAGTVIPDGIW